MTQLPLQKRAGQVLIRHIALPQDHGSWVFLFSPLLIGFFCSSKWSEASIFLAVAALAAFLIRQPVTIAVKCYTGRRPKRELPAAWFWIAVYGFISAGALVGLIFLGFGYLMFLAIPGIPVFGWHLYLVSKRAERKQLGVELVGSGVLALAAPAAFWVGEAYPNPIGWLLFCLVWLQSAASIVFAYLRLEQRTMESKPSPRELLRLGRRALYYSSFNLGLVSMLSILGITPLWLFSPYLLQELETIRGVFLPAIGAKPTAIGIRQLVVSSLFTLFFILTWHI
jgi:hypothetical protein